MTERNKLTQSDVDNAGPRAKSYPLSDGGDLALQVRPTTGKRTWYVRRKIKGKLINRRIGHPETMSLQEARGASGA